MARKRSFFRRSKYYLLLILAGLLVSLYVNRHQITCIDDLLSAIDDRVLLGNVSSDGMVYEGIAAIVDGDTLKIAEQKIRLYAIRCP